jgi:hypothetical protein
METDGLHMDSDKLFRMHISAASLLADRNIFKQKTSLLV